jgi:hypothetical protein
MPDRDPQQSDGRDYNQSSHVFLLLHVFRCYLRCRFTAAGIPTQAKDRFECAAHNNVRNLRYCACPENAEQETLGCQFTNAPFGLSFHAQT